MKKYFFIFLITFLITEASASKKNKIINSLKNKNNFTFNFEQNINGKTENGECVISYPKKIFCKYNLPNNKIIVSNGQSLVVKTKSSYYLYPLKRTPLDLILSKEFLLKKIDNLEERIIDNKFVNYNFSENNFEINIFFDYDSYNLIGWQTEDIYQNLSITFISSVIKNKSIDENLFKLPKQN